MISISLFMIVVMTGITTLLNANSVHHKTKNLRAIMDNINFIMEDMSRNMRTGYNFRCYDGSPAWDDDYAQDIPLDDPASCEFGSVLVFEEAHGIATPDANNDQWVYKIYESGGKHFISKSTNGGLSFIKLNADEVDIHEFSGFSVLGAEPESTNTQQPLIIIRLGGDITYKGQITSFAIQTAISQRLIDTE